jgi:hypothetical protein
MSGPRLLCDARTGSAVSVSALATRVMILVLATSMLLFAAPAAANGRSPGCAAREPHPGRPVAAGVRRLVPSGAATLLLCRYRGLNPSRTALRLRSARLLTGRAEITSITAALNRLPPATAVFHCPMDDGSAILARFTYPAGREVVIRIALRGCRTVAGPYLPVRTAISPGGARLVAKLERLLA